MKVAVIDGFFFNVEQLISIAVELTDGDEALAGETEIDISITLLSGDGADYDIRRAIPMDPDEYRVSRHLRGGEDIEYRFGSSWVTREEVDEKKLVIDALARVRSQVAMAVGVQ